MSLRDLSELLESNSNNSHQFDKIVLEYTKSESLSFEEPSVYNNPDALLFLKNLTKPYYRIESEFSSKEDYFCSLSKFFCHTFDIHPTLINEFCDLIPILSILKVILMDISHDFKNCLLQLLSRIFSSVKFDFEKDDIAYILNSYFVFITTEQTRSQGFCGLSGLVNNSNSFMLAIRSSANLKKVKDLATELLSSDDHIGVISSLSFLTKMFPKSIKDNLVKSACFMLYQFLIRVC